MSWNLPAAGHEEQTSEDVYINALQGADHNSEGDNEVVRYLEMTNKPDKAWKDELSWWSIFGSERFEYLPQFAKDVYAVMGSSVHSSLVFSGNGQSIPADRHSISDENLERNMMLRSWKLCSGNVWMTVRLNLV
jgi:hAT family C-terminal dimerisation region